MHLAPLAFRTPVLPTAPQRRSRHQTICALERPRARRLSLPTFRERRYLAQNYVERPKGRAKYFARATAFTLTAWPLVVRELTPDEQRRAEGWRKRQLTELDTQQAAKGSEEEQQEEDGQSDDVYSFEDENELPLPVLSDSDSLLLHEVEGAEAEEAEAGEAEAEEAEAGEAEAEEAEASLRRGPDSWYPETFQIPPWAYIVRVRAGKQVLGKRAVQRNRAKRRIRAAASRICPDHACRGREYIFASNPEVLTIDFAELVEEVADALKKANCWEDTMTEEMLRRERYCSK